MTVVLQSATRPTLPEPQDPAPKSLVETLGQSALGRWEELLEHAASTACMVGDPRSVGSATGVSSNSSAPLSCGGTSAGASQSAAWTNSIPGPQQWGAALPSFPQGAQGGGFATTPGWLPNSGATWIDTTYPAAPNLAAAHERMLDVLETAAGPVRGKAYVALARWLTSAGLCEDVLGGAELAADLLGVEADTACEALTVLIADGWERTLGELLACARAL